ncbi:phytanoyl-CoA dioxygenase family protein [Paenibacillus qinlingensis]|uniref:Ectoine hydroxylase-related dioxygenase (Phytanoyl-CoA dioxygenase family) n=1 Tax=Paenibacillus qinlingensis TaxID=1837343 RepID=A0ABU1NSR6_9BACL|nr:phytanoyl-CoA dioxygenase family protein [Paenibacillus qinlingensis]MDR6550527.1 ectoine hydroxylase-related dioxygenase (phytanoyl-CoA dioxygenase family) [Paenibacillus qinlingensis]
MAIQAQKTYKITEADKATFERDGYWISPKILDDNQIERLRKAHDRVWSGDYDGDGMPMNPYRPSVNPDALRKLDNGWWINDDIRDTVTDPFIGELVADLLQVNEIRLWHDQVILKPGVGNKETSSGNVGWHQDYGYWQCSSTSEMITVWIALQDTDLTNGGMMTILGSHKWGLIPDSNTFFNQNMDELKEKYAGGREWVEEPCILKAGQASFHHGLTFHGSGANQTNEARLSIVAHVMPGGTSYLSGIQHHSNIRLLGPRPYHGQPFDNVYFPTLFKR